MLLTRIAKVRAISGQVDALPDLNSIGPQNVRSTSRFEWKQMKRKMGKM